MKKLLVHVVITVFLLSGCGMRSGEQIPVIGQAAGNDISEEQNIAEEQSATPRKTPIACEIALEFNTEQEFVAAVKEASKETDGDKSSLEGIKHYFVPEVIPEGVTLDYIAVKDFYVALWYTYDKEPDPFWERTFIFEWYRTKTTGDTEKNLKREYPEEKIKRKNEYYIIKVEPWDGYKGDKEYVCQEVFWEKGGYAFHAIVPTSFTEEDIAKYCVAKKVNVD